VVAVGVVQLYIAEVFGRLHDHSQAVEAANVYAVFFVAHGVYVYVNVWQI
jgi:hypothetical protein